MGDQYIRTSTLEAIGRKVLQQYDPYYINAEPQAVPIETIIERVYGLKIDMVRLRIAGDELGRMIYDNGYTIRYNPDKDDYELMPVKAGTMLIDALLANDLKQYGRYRFTLAHELAHWILHKQLYLGTGVAAASYRLDKQYDYSEEWQANFLATAILMPIGQVKRGFHQIRSKHGTGKKAAKVLADTFEVSAESMGYRLSDLGLLE